MVLKRSVRIPFFRIWYSSAFVILFLITFVLTLVSPADLIYQAAKDNRKIANIIAVAAVYFAAALLCLFIWASRIYTNRAVLRDIPKHYLPIEAGEVPRKVRRLIEKQWRRSALVAWDSRPRDVSLEIASDETINAPRPAATSTAVATASIVDDEEAAAVAISRRHDRRFRRRDRTKDATTLSAKVALKAWGRIAHPGWSAPDAASGQEESVQYSTVIVELPHLLEAKAVSLAPPPPPPREPELLRKMATSNMSSADDASERSVGHPDPRVVAVLQRPPQMGLRSYINHLVALGVVATPQDAEHFLSQYEYARFSTIPLSETQFSGLMTAFATLLSGMVLDLDRITPILDFSDDDDSSNSNMSLETRSVMSQSSNVERTKFVPDGASAYSDGTAGPLNSMPISRMASAATSRSSLNGSIGSVIIKHVKDKSTS